MKRARATVGVSDHAGYALFVTVTRDGALIDRRRVALLDDGLPTMPHHHEGQRVPIDEAVALVARVRESAQRSAVSRLDELARSLPSVELAGIALRVDPTLPPTVAERIADYRAMCVADWVMFRHGLADAARARGWSEHRYDAKRVIEGAARSLGRPSVDALLASAGEAVGAPWTKDHEVAMAAAIVAGRATRTATGSTRRRAGR